MNVHLLSRKPLYIVSLIMRTTISGLSSYEKTSLYARDRIDDGTGVVLGLKEFGFGDIEGGERGIEVEMQSVGIPHLALGQPGELLGIS